MINYIYICTEALACRFNFFLWLVKNVVNKFRYSFWEQPPAVLMAMTTLANLGGRPQPNHLPTSTPHKDYNSKKPSVFPFLTFYSYYYFAS